MDSNTHLPRLHGTHNMTKMLQQFDWLSLYISYIEAYEFWIRNPGVSLTSLVPGMEHILPPLTGHLAIDEILTHVLRNPETDLRQKVVADRFFLNQSYLSTLFHTKTGVLFSEYIHVVKILRARYLVRHSTILIGDISKKVGYADKNYFSRKFHKQFGLSPQKYRRALGTIHLPTVFEP